MNTRRFSRMVATALAVPIGFVVAGGIAGADVPSPGDSCAVLHATTTDKDGATMWCNMMMTGTHGLVWQYGGPG